MYFPLGNFELYWVLDGNQAISTLILVVFLILPWRPLNSAEKKKSFQLDLEVSISMVVILRDKEAGFITPEKMPDFLGGGGHSP